MPPVNHQKCLNTPFCITFCGSEFLYLFWGKPWNPINWNKFKWSMVDYYRLSLVNLFSNRIALIQAEYWPQQTSKCQR